MGAVYGGSIPSVLTKKFYLGAVPKWLRGRFAKPLARDERGASSNLACSVNFLSDLFIKDHFSINIEDTFGDVLKWTKKKQVYR